jgi:uncharacterized protein (TIGR02271 family)
MKESGRRARSTRAEDVAPPPRAEGGETQPIPIVHEEVQVEKEIRETNRVAVRVEPFLEREVIDLPLLQHDVEIERVPQNRPVDAVSPPREEGGTLVVPVYEEVLVVEKRLVLREEIRIRRRASERREKREVELRKERAQVLHPRDDSK